MNKKVVISGEEYKPGYPVCQGCENLTVADGWECFYKPDTIFCEYPVEMLARFRNAAMKTLAGEQPPVQTE